MSRRQLQIALGLLWLLDGALQAQPFMFTSGFATQVIAPAGQGQPALVAAPVHWVSTAIAAHPVPWNAAFTAIQLSIGAGLLVRRTARPALAASIAWGLGVWYFGEGLLGLAGGDASLSAGAPGAALLLAVLAAAAWPGRDASRERPAAWLPLVWAIVWIGGAVFEAVESGSSVLVAVEYLVGAGALYARTRVPAAALGLGLALAFWGFDQAFGGLTSGQATDPNTGPVLALMAIAVMGTGVSPVSRRAMRRTGSRRAGPAAGTSPPLVPRSAS
ncbi:MAG TPA: hypothetical protein VF072_02270 [Thermoleophilaceae bacterium]